MKLCCRAAVALTQKWGWAQPMTGRAAVAEVHLDRCRELEVELVRARLDSTRELAAA